MSNRTGAPPVHILLVEDNPGDIRLVKEAFWESWSESDIVAVSDGEAAMNYLRRRGAYHDAKRVDLVLLDLNLPKKDGHSVLADIKADPDLKHTPVIVMTGSEAEQDIRKAYELQGNCVIHKAADLSQYIGMIQAVRSFWLTVVKLPGAVS